jgi:hypothetical protein
VTLLCEHSPDIVRRSGTGTLSLCAECQAGELRFSVEPWSLVQSALRALHQCKAALFPRLSYDPLLQEPEHSFGVVDVVRPRQARHPSTDKFV